MAEALAHFSLGILQETLLKGSAVESYQRALLAKPDHHELYVHTAGLYLRQGQTEEAIALMEEACRRNPKALEPRLYLAQIYQALTRPAEAIKTVQRAIRLEPKNFKGYIQLAFFYLAQRDEAQALAVLEEARKKATDKLPVLRFLGDIYAQKAVDPSVIPSPEAVKAIAYYEEAATLPPDEDELPYQERLADLYLLNRQLDKALAAFQSLAARLPNSSKIQKKLAVCYLALGQKEKALESLKAVAGREPENSQVQFYLGELYETLGDTNRALVSFRTSVETLPDTSTPYLRLLFYYLKLEPEKVGQVLQSGLERFPEDQQLLELAIPYYLRNQQPLKALEAYVRLQNLVARNNERSPDSISLLFFSELAQQHKLNDLAASLLEKALDQDPDSLEPYLRLVALHLSEEAWDEALNVMSEMVQRFPDDPVPWYYYGLLCNRLEVYRLAVSAFERAEALSPRLAKPELLLDDEFYFNYGAAAERSGDWERAEELLQRAVRLNPENAEAFNYLAYMWAEKGIHLEQARDYVEHALDYEPDNGAFLDTLGWVLYKQKQAAEALTWLEAAHYFMPEDPTILEHLGDVWQALGNAKEAVAWWLRSYQFNSMNEILVEKLRAHGQDLKASRGRQTVL